VFKALDLPPSKKLDFFFFKSELAVKKISADGVDEPCSFVS
jgi:hypothetical protein